MNKKLALEPAVQGNALFRAAEMVSIAGRDASRRVLLAQAVTRSPDVQIAQNWYDRASGRGDQGYIRDFLGAALSASRPDAELPKWLVAARDEADKIAPYSASELRERLAIARPISPSDRSGPLCYVLHMSLPENASGYAVRSHHLVQAMQKNGIDPYCVTRLGFPRDAGQPSDAPQQIVDGVTYHRILGPSIRKFHNMQYLSAAARALVEQLRPLEPRAIMAASNHENAAPALLAARQLGVPFIYEMRGFWELSGLAVNPSNAKSEQFKTTVEMEAELARQADLVFTLTNAMREELRRRGVENPNIRILPNAADPDVFRPAPRDAELSRKLGIAPNIPVIGYVGSFTTYEGLDDLVRACARLPQKGHDFRLLLVGSEPKYLKDKICPELERLASEGGISDKLIMPGRVPVHDVDRWYSLIDIVPIARKDLQVTRLVPPLKPLEAMAMGKSVVVTDLPALREIVTDSEDGIIVPCNDIDALADALGLLISDSDLRRGLGVRARDVVVGGRNWDDVVVSLKQAFSQTLG